MGLEISSRKRSRFLRSEEGSTGRRRKCWFLSAERPGQRGKVQTAIKHRSKAPKFISYHLPPRSTTCQGKTTRGAPAGPSETLERGRKGRRLQSSLLSEEEHNLVDFMEP